MVTGSSLDQAQDAQLTKWSKPFLLSKFDERFCDRECE